MTSPSPAPLTLDQMIDEEELRFEPIDGTFDAERIAIFVEALGPCFRDPVMPGLFVLAPDAATRDQLLQRRHDHPEIPPPFTLLIEVAPASVLVFPVNSGALAGMSRTALDWLTATWPCRITNGHGTQVAVAPLD